MGNELCRKMCSSQLMRLKLEKDESALFGDECESCNWNLKRNIIVSQTQNSLSDSGRTVF